MTSSSRPVTPLIFKGTSTSEYRVGELNKARSAFLDDLGDWIPMVPFQTFVDHILPQVPDIDISETQEVLQQREMYTKDDGELRWKCCKIKPSDNPKREEQAFMFLKKLYTTIIQNVQFKTKTGHRKPTLEYVTCASFVPISMRQNTSRPDGFGKLVPTEPSSTADVISKSGHPSPPEENKNTHEHNWRDIVVVDEYKKKNNRTNRLDNAQKVLWSLHHIMRNDPRRRAAFGITIEDTRTQVWFCSRQIIIVSEPFDLIEDFNQFIQLVLSLFFGDPKDLGLDPTFKLQWGPEGWTYTIQVHHEGKVLEYQTMITVSSYSADSIRGRATRIYVANRIYPKKPKGNLGKARKVIIKDFWIDSDRQKEDKILKAILDKASDRDSAKKLFLTSIASGNVLINDESDNTETLGMRGLQISQAVPLAPALVPQDGQSALLVSRYSIKPHEKAPGGDAKSNVSVGLHRSVDEVNVGPPESVQFNPKDHFRIVFAQVGKKMESQSNLGKGMNNILQILIDVIDALEIMYRAGYVHRDVTPANIISVASRGRLIDLEYAKKITDQDTRHYVRSGTVDFISQEVIKSRYLWNSHLETTSQKFVHNPIHDLESIWWILLYFLTFYAHDELPNSAWSETSASAQFRAAKDIFSQDGNNAHRFMMFRSPGFISNQFSAYCFPGILHIIRKTYGVLEKAYEGAEKNLTENQPIDTTAFEGIHAQFKAILESAKNQNNHNQRLFFINDIIKRFSAKSGGHNNDGPP